MDQFLRDPDRNTILVVNEIRPRSLPMFVEAVEKVGKQLKRDMQVLVLSEKRDKHLAKQKLPANFTQIKVNTDSLLQLEEALIPWLDKLVCVVARSEKDMPIFKRIIPQIPYLQTPNTDTIDWATDKILMRRRLRQFNNRTSPKYTIVEDASEASLAKIRRKVGFPLIVKPAGLAASVMVSVCYHEEELQATLNNAFKKMKNIYKRRGRSTVPRILVEEYFEGTQYSTDIYVNDRGTMYVTPLVHIETGRSVGMGDFFGYKQITPVTKKPHAQIRAFNVAKEAVKALGLRSVTAHVELLKTDDGWKVIEVGPRVGGFRDFLYKESYDIDHSYNDIVIRMPMRPQIPRKTKGHSAVMKIYPREQGTIKAITGVKKVKSIESFKKIEIHAKKGDKAIFARNGGVSIADVYLHNKSRSQLLADMRRVETNLEINVSKSRSATSIIPPLREDMPIDDSLAK